MATDIWCEAKRCKHRLATKPHGLCGLKDVSVQPDDVSLAACNSYAKKPYRKSRATARKSGRRVTNSQGAAPRKE